LQVEHAITEEVMGIDLVEWQLRIASGEPLALTQDALQPDGHAVECRLYAEDPSNDFLPASGRITHLREPRGPGIRMESGLSTGMEIGIDYDPMLAKVITTAPTRAQAIARMQTALDDYTIRGLTTNLILLQSLLRSTAVVQGTGDTHFVAQFVAQESVQRAPHGDPFTPWVAQQHSWRLGGGGTIFRSVVRTNGRARRRHRPGGDLTAPMPGRIVKLLVVPGTAVDADATLLVMEAMKMEYAIKAPEAGTLERYLCAEGDMVAKGKKLIEVKS
jgi:acetyl/propionyl-CoA carboxylase alpha subunit